MVAAPFVIPFVPGSNGVFVIAGAAATIGLRFLPIPRTLDAIAVVVLAIATWGNPLGLYDSVDWFDKLVHALASGTVGAVFYFALLGFEQLPQPRERERLGAFVVIVSLSLAVGALWEIVEWTLDSAAGTRLTTSEQGTATDLISDAVGALIGGYLATVYVTRSRFARRGAHADEAGTRRAR